MQLLLESSGFLILWGEGKGHAACLVVRVDCVALISKYISPVGEHKSCGGRPWPIVMSTCIILDLCNLTKLSVQLNKLICVSSGMFFVSKASFSFRHCPWHCY